MFGFIKPFNLGPITFPDMSGYERYNYVFNFRISGIINSIMTLVSFHDFTAEMFRTLGLLFAPLVGFGFYFAFSKNPKFKIEHKEVYIPFLITVIIFALTTNSSFHTYRYSSMEFLLSFLVGQFVLKAFSLKTFRRIFSCVMALLIVMLTAYLPNSFSKSYAAIEQMKEQSINSFSIILPETTDAADKTHDELSKLSKESVYYYLLYSYSLQLIYDDQEFDNNKDIMQKQIEENALYANEKFLITTDEALVKPGQYIFSLVELPEEYYETVTKYSNSCLYIKTAQEN